MHSRRVRRVPIVDETELTLGMVILDDDLIALFADKMSKLGTAVSEEFRRVTA